MTNCNNLKLTKPNYITKPKIILFKLFKILQLYCVLTKY